MSIPNLIKTHVVLSLQVLKLFFGSDRHALPPGYVLKSDLKKKDDEENKISIEELIEKERAALGPNTTKV